MQNVYEHFFLLKYYGGWCLTESYSLPIGLRNWFLHRLEKQLEKEAEQVEESKRKSKRKR